MSVKKVLLYIGVTLVLFASACSGPSNEEEIYNHLEEAVQLESGFAKQQDIITDLETQEREIFDQIIALEMKDFDRIKELAEDALGVIDERSKQIEIEKESIHASQTEFEKTKDSIDKLENETVKKKAEEMYAVMNERYDAYDKIHVAYIESLKQEEALYKMLQDEDVSQEDYAIQTTKVNETYEVVLAENQVFNEATTNYNELKKAFYDLADFNVTYDEN